MKKFAEMTVEELQVMATKVAEQAKEETKELVVRTRLVAQIENNQCGVLKEARAAAEIKKETTKSLDRLEARMEAIVENTKVFNNATKEDRKWNPSKVYGFGNQIATLAGILSGILYSVSEHKTQMLMVSGLDLDMIEETVNAFGSTAYYSPKYDIVVEEKPYNAAVLKNNLTLIADTLGIELDTRGITHQALASRFRTAKLAAEQKQLEAEKTALMAQQKVKID